MPTIAQVNTILSLGIKYQALIISHLFRIISDQLVQVKLWNENDNRVGLEKHVKSMISSAFPHLSSTQVDTFVLGLFDLNKGSQETFKAHLRDFLISLKEFSEGDNSELYLEEKELEIERKRQAGN